MLEVTWEWTAISVVAGAGYLVYLVYRVCWVSGNGVASYPGMTSNTPLCWVACDGLASPPGGSSNTPSHFMLGSL